MILPLILYPVARGKDGSPIHIDDWQHGQEVTCFGCGDDLVGHLPHDGIKPTAHFAHKVDATCDAETALRKAAKAAIIHAHRNGTLQGLSWQCPRCLRQTNNIDLCSRALAEDASPCEGVVSDVLATVVFGDSTAPRIAIDVAVTRGVEPTTIARYHEHGIDVLSFHPSWALVADLSRGLTFLTVTHRTGVIDTSSCVGCQTIVREKREWGDLDRSRTANQWWDLWIGLWRSAGRELSARASSEQDVLRQTETREHIWWQRWSAIWPRIAVEISGTWWSQWHTLWVDVGVEYMRPYRWMDRWLDAWESIGRQYAADGVDHERKRRLDEDRRDVWWARWLRMWKDIGQRESGATAAWKPICRKCRDDLRPDHRCPRDDVVSL